MFLRPPAGYRRPDSVPWGLVPDLSQAWEPGPLHMAQYWPRHWGWGAPLLDVHGASMFPPETLLGPRSS